MRAVGTPGRASQRGSRPTLLGGLERLRLIVRQDNQAVSDKLLGVMKPAAVAAAAGAVVEQTREGWTNEAHGHQRENPDAAELTHAPPHAHTPPLPAAYREGPSRPCPPQTGHTTRVWLRPRAAVLAVPSNAGLVAVKAAPEEASEPALLWLSAAAAAEDVCSEAALALALALLLTPTLALAAAPAPPPDAAMDRFHSEASAGSISMAFCSWASLEAGRWQSCWKPWPLPSGSCMLSALSVRPKCCTREEETSLPKGPCAERLGAQLGMRSKSRPCDAVRSSRLPPWGSAGAGSWIVPVTWKGVQGGGGKEDRVA